MTTSNHVQLSAHVQHGGHWLLALVNQARKDGSELPFWMMPFFWVVPFLTREGGLGSQVCSKYITINHLS